MNATVIGEPKVMWEIINEKRAKELKLSVFHVDGTVGYLVIDLNDIPQGMSAVEYIDFAQNSGIIAKQTRHIY